MRYFIATYYQKPKGRDGSPGKHSEQVKTDSRVRPKDLQQAGIILDYRDRKVIKCHFQADNGQARDFNTISEFYKGHYNNLISQLEAKYELLDAVQGMAKEIVQAEVDEAVAARTEATAEQEAE